jgi:hypothetical protein
MSVAAWRHFGWSGVMMDGRVELLWARHNQKGNNQPHSMEAWSGVMVNCNDTATSKQGWSGRLHIDYWIVAPSGASLVKLQYEAIRRQHGTPLNRKQYDGNMSEATTQQSTK